MTTSMDIPFPELSAPRERNIEPASRRSEPSGSEFAELLDVSLNEPRERTRDFDEPKSPPRVAAGTDPAAQDETIERQAEAPADLAQPAEKPAAPQEPAQPAAAETVDAPAKEASAAAAGEMSAAPPVAPQVPPSPGPAPVGPGANPQTAGSAAPGLPLPQQAMASPLPANPPGDAAAKNIPQQPQAEAARQNTFAAVMVAAAAKPAEPAGAQPKVKANSEAGASPAASPRPVPAQPMTVAAVPEVKAANGHVQNSQRPPGSDVAAPAQSAPAVETLPQDVAPASDEQDAAALLRTNGASAAMAANRPATKEAAVAPIPVSSLATADTKIEITPPPPEHARPEGPTRPFGTLAPGLSVAAQIAAQQTPEQANAAERLAQLAGARDVEASIQSDKGAADTVKAAEAPAPAARLDQAAHAEANAARTLSADPATAAAHARSARPAFHPMIAQVAAHVAQAAIDGNDRINIRLSPSDLGRIDVRLDFGPDGRVQAVFAADRAQTVELLQRDARDLERALQDAGLSADSGSLSFNLRGDGRSGPEDGAPQQGSGGHTDAVVEVPIAHMQAYGAGAAASGRLDIRI